MSSRFFNARLCVQITKSLYNLAMYETKLQLWCQTQVLSELQNIWHPFISMLSNYHTNFLNPAKNRNSKMKCTKRSTKGDDKRKGCPV